MLVTKKSRGFTLEASIALALRIAKPSKPHNIVETLLLSAIEGVCSAVMVEKSIIIAQTNSIGVEIYSTSMEKDIEDAENASNIEMP